MMRSPHISRFLRFVFLSIALFSSTFSTLHAQILPRILPDCDGSLPPSDPDACGMDQFVELLKNIITFASVIVIPISLAVIIWGGIVIMTAAGSADRVAKGRQIITTTVIGLAIVLGSWLIINTVYLALTGSGVEENIN